MFERFVHGLGPRDRALVTALAAATTWGMLAVGAMAGLAWLAIGGTLTLRLRRGRRTAGAAPGHGPEPTGGVADTQERVLRRLRSMTSGPHG